MFLKWSSRYSGEIWCSKVSVLINNFGDDPKPCLSLQKDGDFKADPRISFLEGARDFAVMDAILESGKKQGELVQVKKF